jgi:hypothetical protein
LQHEFGAQVANFGHFFTGTHIAVYLDKQIVPRDGSNGWILAQDQRSVLFSGSYCEGIKAEKYKLVQVYFGCPNTEPPTVIP